MTTFNCLRCKKSFPVDGVCMSGHLHQIEPGMPCICADCGCLMILDAEGSAFREPNADDLRKIPAPVLLWAYTFQARIQVRKIIDGIRAAAANN